ncbi:hypothetical protein P4H42_05665 [Paenibacillus macerans]|uniref:hypothetical protein n=1 Tax=Paenibacillus macerans TaxID=44252 RepID=UPI002DBAB2A9|nr:hypothetical protein [Paenibacillus macerans]MEC0329110.1 hypothetical protein [Paenibacillus macerans]MED4954255.1 hypothetical protein [Paenibacillus macerans]
MKKIPFIILLTLLIVLVGCENDRISTETGSTSTILEKLEFNQAVGVYSTNIEPSGSSVSSFFLFGLASNLKKESFDTLNNSDISITLSNEKKDEIKFTPEEIKWELTDPSLLKGGFFIHLTSDRIVGFEKLVLDKIKFDVNKNSITKNINPVYLQFYSGEQNGVSVMESPLAPKNEVALQKEYTYSYKILDSNHIITSAVKAELIYPEDIKNYIEIVDIEVNHDKNTEEQLKEEYKGKVDEKKLKGIQVYEIKCTYIIRKKGNIVFQPAIKIIFKNKEQILAPSEPVSFFNFSTT